MAFIYNAVEDFVEGVGDVVGDVVEAVGDFVSDVGDALGDAANWIGDNIIQPILDDPITFIVSAAALAYGIPGLSFAGPGTAAAAGIATTGSRLVQGDDFDDAIKAGVFAGAATGVTNSIAKGISTGGKNFSPNLYSTADELAASAAGKSSLSSSAGRSSTAPPAPGVDLINEGQLAQAADDPLIRQLADAEALANDFTPDQYELLADASGDTQLVKKTTGDPLLDAATDVPEPGANKPSPLQQAANAAPDGAPTNKPPSETAFGKDYKSSIGDIDAGMTSDYTDMSRRADKPAPRGFVDDPVMGEPGYKPPIEDRSPRPGNEKYVIDPASGMPVRANPDPTALQGATKLAGAIGEKAGSWVWDGAKWVWDNPLEAAALVYGAGMLLGGDEPPGDDKTGRDENQKKSDSQFYSDLDQLELRRARQPMLNRSENPYESGGLYTYGETGGEHEFYGPTVYQPVEYSQPITAAQGGSIGALNSQMPSYFRYGAMPMATGGYASGGLRSLKHDGRSDHIPAMLSDGEYVIDAETVALLGNGSNEAGANRLEGMRQEVRKQKGKALSKGKFSSNAKSPLSYMKQRKG